MERGQKNHAHFADVFFQFVRSGEEPTVGGFPQLLIATQDGVTIEPVLIGDETGNARLIHSGINVDGYNTVGKYMIGLNIEGFNMEIAHRIRSLRTNSKKDTSHSEVILSFKYYATHAMKHL